MNAAAIAAPDTQLSITRSMNVMTVHDRADTTSGAGNPHHFAPAAGPRPPGVAYRAGIAWMPYLPSLP